MRFRNHLRAVAFLVVAALAVAACWSYTASAAPARPVVFVVNSADDVRDDGCDAAHCNLREAIAAANAEARRGRPAHIRFNLPERATTITPRAALPALLDNVVLDGASQPGTACPTPVVQLDGARSADPSREDAAPINGLVIAGSRNVVRGLVISNFSGHGVVVHGDENTLECLFVGTDPSGTSAAGNARDGIVVESGHSNRLGGDRAEQANLISANGGRGIRIKDALNTYEILNDVGVDVFGRPTLPNGGAMFADGGIPLLPPLDAATAERLSRMVEHRLDALTHELVTSPTRSHLLEDYSRLLGLKGRQRPTNLTDLVALLAADRAGLYAAFTDDMSRFLDVERLDTARQIDRLPVEFRRLPRFRRDVPSSPIDRRDLLEEALANAPTDSYVRARPPDVVALLSASLLTQADDFVLSLLRTYRPLGIDELGDVFESVDGCTIPLAPCTWPGRYDLLPYSTLLVWKTSMLTTQNVADIVQGNGYMLTLWVNGMLLLDGSGYATLPAAQCAGGACIATTILPRSTLASVPLPWTFELRVEKLEDLPSPVFTVDGNGNPVEITKQWVMFSRTFRKVLPNDTSGKKWFTEWLLPTFHSARCVMCHGFENVGPLAIHHGYGYLGDAAAPTFANDVNLKLEPSAYVPGAHVMTCDSCHVVPETDSHGSPFAEIQWKAPFADLDTNWGKKDAAQVCGRVTANLPTKALRYEHFHKDGRLYWAIEQPYIMGVDKKPHAEPMDFDVFLSRIDAWNNFGAPCP